MASVTNVPRSAWYYRRIAGTDFTMEANTPGTPVGGRFFLLRGAEVLLQSKDFGVVEAAYKELCVTYWEEHLGSGDAEVSMSCAWGLLGQNEHHRNARDVIIKHGSASDQRRLEVQQRRKWAERRKPPMRG